MELVLPIFLFVGGALAVPLGMIAAGRIFSPRRQGAVKAMPYESGMDPIHDTRRRFDVRFHLVAIAFLVFDVELLFLYPWAVASHAVGPRPNDPGPGIDWAIAAPQQLVESRQVVFVQVLVFLGLLALGYVYAWRKGVFQWR